MKQSPIPFSNGTEGMMWYDNNCCQCRHINNCAIENGIALSAATGTISQNLLDRAGGIQDERGHFVECNEKNKRKGMTKRHVASDHPQLFEPHQPTTKGA